MSEAQVVTDDGPVARTSYVTHDPEAAHARMSDTYHNLKIRLTGDRSGFLLRHELATAGPYAVARIRNTSAGEVEARDPNPAVFVTALVAGRYAVGTARERVALEPGGIVLTPPGLVQPSGWSDVDLRVVHLTDEDLQSAAAEATGIEPGSLRWTGRRPVSAALERNWLAVLGYAERLLRPDHAEVATPLVLTGVGRLLAHTALATFPSTAMIASRLPAGSGRVAPTVVLRAIAHMEEHADRPLLLLDIATAAGVGPRALQIAFRRHLDTTPLGYLRQVRLDRAHQDLQEADPTRGDTVAAIGARWGFPSPSHFTSAYRSAYGCPPSRTLHT